MEYALLSSMSKDELAVLEWALTMLRPRYKAWLEQRDSGTLKGTADENIKQFEVLEKLYQELL